MPTIKLQSSDGEMFEVDVEIAKQSVTIKTMLEGNKTCYCIMWCSHHVVLLFNTCVEPSDLGMDDEGDDDPVPLPNVNAAILKKVRRQRLNTS